MYLHKWTLSKYVQVLSSISFTQYMYDHVLYYHPKFSRLNSKSPSNLIPMTKKVHGGLHCRFQDQLYKEKTNTCNEYMHMYILSRSAEFPCHVGTSLLTPSSSKHDRCWASGYSPTGHGSRSVPECRGHRQTSSRSSDRWSSLA